MLIGARQEDGCSVVCETKPCDGYNTNIFMLILMHWHRQAIFESTWDKLPSSHETRICLWNPFSSRLKVRPQTDWAIEDQAKNLNSITVPMMSELSAHLTPLPVGSGDTYARSRNYQRSIFHPVIYLLTLLMVSSNGKLLNRSLHEVVYSQIHFPQPLVQGMAQVQPLYLNRWWSGSLVTYIIV